MKIAFDGTLDEVQVRLRIGRWVIRARRRARQVKLVIVLPRPDPPEAGGDIVAEWGPFTVGVRLVGVAAHVVVTCGDQRVWERVVGSAPESMRVQIEGLRIEGTWRIEGARG